MSSVTFEVITATKMTRNIHLQDRSSALKVETVCSSETLVSTTSQHGVTTQNNVVSMSSIGVLYTFPFLLHILLLSVV